MNNRVGFCQPFLYIYGMMKDERKLDGLSVRHVAQIVRRKMITRISKSANMYIRKPRNNKKYDLNE
jgi:hypothetical protein